MGDTNKFLKQSVFAVAGASEDREKYGNKTLRVYQQNNMKVYPLNPKSTQIEGLDVIRDVASLPDSVDALSIVTPPAVTRHIVKAALDKGIKHFWMQPGAENDEAIAEAEKAGANVIYGGPCVLVALNYRE